MDKSGDILMGNAGPTGSLRTINGSLRHPISLEATPLEPTPDLSGEVSGVLNLTDTEDVSDDSMSTGSIGSDNVSGNLEDHPPRLLPLASLRSGLCYDDRMRYHAEVAAISDLHPEDPRRIWFIYRSLCKAGLVEDPIAELPLVDKPLFRIKARHATREEICEVHTSEHYEFVKDTQYKDEEYLQYLEATMDSIYFNKLSFDSSLLSCGGAIETCKAVVSRKVKNAIAVIRPPGHHAELDKPMGFCLFNNVCVAARVCQREFPEQCRKILILDWDVHHGNGIQKVFYDDPNILYISIHVHQDGTFYPGGPEGDMDHTGHGLGVGKNVNIPWPTKGMGDGDYMFAFQQIVMPIANEFSPDLVIISAGFDAAAGDELGGCFVTPTCYAHMTHMLMSLANGKVVVCLEGGYNFTSISKSALAVTRTLMGEPPDRLPPTSATDSAIKTVRRVAQKQSKFWRCMFPQEPVNAIVQGQRMHDVLREYQAKHYFDQYRMNSLYILRNELSASFRDQVLATPNYDQQKDLLMIFHDPPDVIGMPDPTSGKLELHNTWLADQAKGIIKWAVDQGFAVIDINIPRYLTEDARNRKGLDLSGHEHRKALTEKLATYIWENYVEVADHDHVFLMGIGNAFWGITRLLTQNDNVYQNSSGIISFIADNPLLPVKNPDNPWLQKWYADNSLNFVAPSHQVWSQHIDRKISKRYGTLVKSSVDRMPEMLVAHRREVFEFLANRAGLDIDIVLDDSTDEALEGTGSSGAGGNGDETEDEVVAEGHEGGKEEQKEEEFMPEEDPRGHGIVDGSALPPPTTTMGVANTTTLPGTSSSTIATANVNNAAVPTTAAPAQQPTVMNPTTHPSATESYPHAHPPPTQGQTQPPL